MCQIHDKGSTGSRLRHGGSKGVKCQELTAHVPPQAQLSGAVSSLTLTYFCEFIALSIINIAISFHRWRMGEAPTTALQIQGAAGGVALRSPKARGE